MTRALAVLCAAAGMVAVGGCVFVVTPGHPTRAEWAGTYARSQAAQHDQDRDVALRVRDALNADPDLEKLQLRIFVDRGEVTLCGGFPDPKLRARAFAIVGQVDGVKGVDTDCGH